MVNIIVNKLLLLQSFITVLILIFTHALVSGQNHHERYNAIDVLDYSFEIELNDSTDMISGLATIKISFKKSLDSFFLDLKKINETGKGMMADRITEDDKPVDFTHRNDQLVININTTETGETRTYIIAYHGIPADGLIISKNKYGDRCFFGDNWPERAHNWLPTVDHPSDKASLEFIITVPSDYQVVANGKNIKETNKENVFISHWQTDVPLPTKIMVIAVARFSRQDVMSVYDVPLSTWVYPQNREEGFRDFSIAAVPLAFFSRQIAPFPFSKLANVQSTTIYGGMENASCIFYHEDAVTGDQQLESLIAHEIAHQWFGDAVSELNWHHVWLSEGFATYLTSLYFEDQYGRDYFVDRMKKEREQVIKFASRKLTPIIDTSMSVSIELLSPNTYEKAAWFLHMLRRELGDELFWECLREFYLRFEYGNALTENFQEIAESLSGKDLNGFFKQWLYMAGHPVLAFSWSYKHNKIDIQLNQVQQQYIFRFPLDIAIKYIDGTVEHRTLDIGKSEETVSLNCEKEAVSIILDPDTWLLFEEMK